MPRLHTIGDMREAARRRLPRFAFDFVEGGAGRESALQRNEAAFSAVALTPRVLSGCTERDLSVQLFGEAYAVPFGVAPIGMAGLVAPGTDLGLARAAAGAGAAYVLSTAGTASIEAVAAAAPGFWFQLYVGRDQAIVDDLIRRAAAAGAKALVVTVDAAAPGKRVRDLNNGFVLPLKPSARMAAELALHPGWSLSMLTGGTPRFVNLDAYAEPGAAAGSHAKLMSEQSSARLDWALLEAIRREWKGPLLVKGLLHPDDAVRALAAGADGLVISNHGGRQLDAAPAPISVIAGVREAVGPAPTLLLDGGVRSGEDIARAVALGADFVLLGRPFLYAAAALGAERGGAALIAMLSDELDRAMAQLGCARLSDLRGVAVAQPVSG